jgi:hypothetical protein
MKYKTFVLWQMLEEDSMNKIVCLSKEDVRNIISEMTTDSNKKTAEDYLKKLEHISQKDFDNFILQFGEDKEQAENLIRKKFKEILKVKKFEKINESISYGVFGDVLRIHFNQKDIKSKEEIENIKRDVVDALKKTKGILINNEELKNIKEVHSKGPLLTNKQVQEIYKGLNFEVKETTSKNLIEKASGEETFYEAKISREKLLSPEVKEKQTTDDMEI